MAAPIQPAELAKFLECYAGHFNFSRACREIDRDRNALYHQLEANADFRLAFEEVRKGMGDNLLAEAYRRAHDGVDKPVYQGGLLVGHIREYSDTLLTQMLKAIRPEFRERTQLEVTNPDGSLSAASDAQIAARIASILAVAQARKARGEIIDAEFTEQKQLPAPSNEDLL